MEIPRWEILNPLEDGYGPGWYKFREDVASIKFLLITKSIVRAGLTVLASQCHIKYDSYVNLTVIQSFKRNKLLENNYQLVSSGFVNSYKWKDVHNEVTCFCLFFSVVNIDYLSSLHFTISFYVCFDKYFLRVINVVGCPAVQRLGYYRQQWDSGQIVPVERP